MAQVLAPGGRTGLHVCVCKPPNGVGRPFFLRFLLPSFNVGTQGPTLLELKMWILRRPQQLGKALYLWPHFQAVKMQLGMVMRETGEKSPLQPALLRGQGLFDLETELEGRLSG